MQYPYVRATAGDGGCAGGEGGCVGGEGGCVSGEDMQGEGW